VRATEGLEGTAEVRRDRLAATSIGRFVAELSGRCGGAIGALGNR
jgi:hypothetical protein